MDAKYSEAELVKFLDYLGTKGLMNESTANARKIAAQKVLSVLEPSEKSDLRTIARDAVFTRFINKYGKDFTPGSLQTYRQRFTSAVDDFISYVDNPAGFKPSNVSRTPRQGSAGVQQTRGNASTGASARGDQRAPTMPHHGLLSYPIPLPSGDMAQLSLPSAITPEDAERISSVVTAMVKALAVEEKGGGQ